MDDELRAAERACRETPDGPARDAYAQLLRRAGRLDDVVDLLHGKVLAPVREHAKFLGRIAAGRRLIVGKGQYGDRYGVVDVEGHEQLWELMATGFDVDGFRGALSEYTTVWPGELDFMYATPWAYAWTVAPAPFHLVAPEGHVARVEGGALVVGEKTIPLALAASVDVSLSKDWAIRKVVLVLRSGERVEVATQTDEIVYADPTYDGINLMCDTSWASHLGRSLAAALSVPCTVAEGIG